MHSLPALVRLAGFNRHWHQAKRTPYEIGFSRSCLPQASGFQFQGTLNFSNNGVEFVPVLFVCCLFAKFQPKFLWFGRACKGWGRGLEGIIPLSTRPTAKRNLDRAGIAFSLLLFLLSVSSGCNQRPAAPGASIGITFRGCLEHAQGNYVVVEDRTTTRFVLMGVGNKISKLLGDEIEVTGTLAPTPDTTGAGSSRPVDGYPLRIENARSDVVSIADHCRASDRP